MYTLGQYIPGHSCIHRLDPRVKILSLLVLSVVMLGVEALEGICLTFLILGVYYLCGLSPRRLMLALKPVFPVLVLLFLMHFFFSEGRPILASLPAVTYEGLYRGGLVVWQFTALVSAGAILTMTTTSSDLVSGIERLLRPLRFLRIPSHDIAIMISVALRFVPTLLEEVERMKEAQVARGADFASGGLVNRLRKMASLVIPLILCTFRRADELALAMEGRGYQRGPRTYLRELKFSRSDYTALLVVSAVLIGVEALRFIPL
jgi:energy-coupling factor transporter transmembrane protein EcfT